MTEKPYNTNKFRIIHNNNSIKTTTDVNIYNLLDKSKFELFFKLKCEKIEKEFKKIEKEKLFISIVNTNNNKIFYYDFKISKEKANFFLMGRNPLNDIKFFGDKKISNQHAVLIANFTKQNNLTIGIRDLNTSLKLQTIKNNNATALLTYNKVLFAIGIYVICIIYKNQQKDLINCENMIYETLNKNVLTYDNLQTYNGLEYLQKHPINEVDFIVQNTHNLTDKEKPSSFEVTLTRDNHSFSKNFKISRHTLLNGIVIGRNPKNEIPTPEEFFGNGVSRTHLLLMLVNNKIYATDLNTTNGTTYNSKIIKTTQIEFDTPMTLAEHLIVKIIKL